MARTCKNCYSSVNDEHKFCTECGKEVPFPEYKESKIENIEEDNQSSDEIKYYKDTGWVIPLVIGCLLFMLFIYLLNPTLNSTNSIHVNTNSIQEVLLPKVETNEPIKNELSLEEKSTLFKEAKKDFDKKNYDSSILKFNKLLGLNYKLDEVKFYLGQNWYMKKVYPMAIVYYKDSAILNDKATYMPTLLHNNAISLGKIKDKENVNALQKELNTVLTPEDKANLLKEAKSDFDSKKYVSSTSKCEKLLEANYRPAEVNFYLGQNYYMRKKYDVAISHFKKSAILNDKAAYMPTLLLNSAISFENIKDNENAKSFYTTLIELYPSTDEAIIAKRNHLLKNNIKKQNESIIEEKPNLYKESENNSYSKKLESTTSSDKYDTSKNVYSPPEQTLPYNGEIKNYSYAEKIAPLNIKTSYGANYLVKLKGAYTKEPIMTIFIRGGNEITINVPLGSFELTYASGNKWYGYDNLFGKETLYSKADEIFNFRDTGYEISGYTITLYRVSNGNLNTQNISQSQF